MAVLYKRKSDQKLVIIKEINLKEMTKDQRNLAINEGFCTFEDSIYYRMIFQRTFSKFWNIQTLFVTCQTLKLILIFT